MDRAENGKVSLHIRDLGGYERNTAKFDAADPTDMLARAWTSPGTRSVTSRADFCGLVGQPQLSPIPKQIQIVYYVDTRP